MMLKLRDLEMVQAIHAEGTLTAASRLLFISQPALSRQVAKLEQRLGAPLFRRHAKGMELTREGVRLLESAERVLDELERAEHEVKLLAQGYLGALRVSTECYMCYHWLPRIARAFGTRFPGVDVQLVPEATRDPFGALERCAVDVALVYSAPLKAGAVHRTALFEDEIVALVADAHPLAGEPHLTADSLRSEALLCHYAEPGRGVVEREFLEPAGVKPKRTMEMLVTPAVIEMARACYGVAILPRWILEAQGALEGLVVLSLGESGLWRTWYAACDADRRAEPLVGSMIRVLGEELQQDEDARATGPQRVHLA